MMEVLAEPETAQKLLASSMTNEACLAANAKPEFLKHSTLRRLKFSKHLQLEIPLETRENA